MIPTGEKQNTQKKYLSQCYLSTKNPTQNGLESNPGFYGDWPATNCLSHSRAYEKDINCVYTSRKSVWDSH
jgi:hypothetical protein